KKVIYDIHEYNADTMLTKHWLPTEARRTVSRAVMWLDRYAVKKMSGIVVVNEDMAKLFRAGLSSPRPVVTVHNYPELQDAALDGGHSADEPVGIYVGGLSKDRGLEVLLEAGERLRRAYPEASIQVLGPLELAGVRREYAFVDGWGAYGVEYLGRVPHRDILKWLQRARVGLIPWLPTPNHLKGTPVKLFEYMLAGIPVVASGFGFISLIVRDTGCGLLVPPGDAAALSKAIEVLLRDPSKAVEMGQRGRIAVLDRYNWGSEEKKLVALYESLVGHA
ncbi:MAG: glycosyltransferase family 4 protein, partial [candidate division NC10 bacterium]|nr:glycosyltransferase family 4 protein [candidate division NC10 bacterium]